MIKLLQRALSGSVSLGLIATLALVAVSVAPAPTAGADVRPAPMFWPGPKPPAPKKFYYKNLSAKKKKDLATAEAIQTKAINKARTVLDYKKANKYDKGRTNARRQFAAGWRARGGKISNISKKELKKVQAIQKLKGKLPKGTKPDGILRDARCTGRTRVVDYPIKGPLFDVRYDFNSCDTDWAISTTDGVAWVAGGIAGFVPPAFPIAGAVGATSLAGTKYMAAVQKQSEVRAITIRDYTHILTIYPQ